MSTHIINFPGADIHTTTITSVSNVSVGENLDVTSNLTVSGNTAISQELSVSGNVEVGTANLFVDTTTGNVGVGVAHPTSAKLQVAGSLGMAKGSEFFAGDDVVMELPKHDRPLVKYPEVAMTANSSGGYVASTSSAPNPSYDAHDAFNIVTTSGNGSWHSGPYYQKSTEATPPLAERTPTSSLSSWTANRGSTTGELTTHNGEWLKIQLPHKIKLKSIILKQRDSYPTQKVRLFSIVGSNDDENWFLVHQELSRGGTSTSIPEPDPHVMTGSYVSEAFKYFAIVIYAGSTDNPYDHVAIGEWELYGTEEGDTSVDVVHRSVPNKPGQQHLEVYWDANDSNSYSFADSSTVYDLSGSGVTGTITGTNGFDAEYNAWVFDGSGDYISGTQGLGTGQPVHSQSVWFKRNGVTGTYQYINIIGTSGGGTQAGFVIMNNGVTLQTSSYGNDIRTIDTVEGQWYHAVLVHTGGDWTSSNTLTYVNGELATVTSVSKNSTFNLTGTTVTLGTNTNGTEGFNGSIANFRLFGKALNADQVRELYEYDAPRFGHRQNLVSLHKGNLGVGVAHPEQRLVVAGSLQEFPPGPMTNEYTHFTGHGIFKVRASINSSAGRHKAAFDKNRSSSSYWYSTQNTYGTSSTNVAGGRNAYTGSNSLGGYSGEWLGLMFPCGFVCKSMEIAARNGEIVSAPHDIVVLGATNPFDETEWETIGTFYGKSSNDFWVDGGVGINFPINYDKPVYGIALVFTAGNYYYAVTVGEIQFVGVPQMNVTDGRQLNVGQVMSSSVGIGVTNPTCPLDLGSTVQNRIISLYGGSSSSDTAYYGFGINNGTLRYNVSATNAVHRFYGESTEFGYVNNGTGFVNSFTGQHKSFPHESLFGKTSDDLCGLIVSASGEYISINDKVPQKGQGAIQVSEAIPTVKLSTSEKDKKVFGVISDVEDVETSQRRDHYGAFVSTFEKEPGDSRIYVNSIGEGAMWVVNTAGALESGDYITTSNVAGYGQRQDDDILHNYTVAKITMDCDFDPPDIPVQRILKELSNVNYWVKTTYSDVSLEEYSNLAGENRTTTTETVYTNEDDEITTDKYNTLESNVQSTYTELTRIIHQKMSTEEYKTEQEGTTLEVRQELVNVLDEHGQLQWEDDPSGTTEKAYKIRYLDTDGNITDEANAVHTAAFVGCTYHCG